MPGQRFGEIVLTSKRQTIKRHLLYGGSISKLNCKKFDIEPANLSRMITDLKEYMKKEMRSPPTVVRSGWGESSSYTLEGGACEAFGIIKRGQLVREYNECPGYLSK